MNQPLTSRSSRTRPARRESPRGSSPAEGSRRVEVSISFDADGKRIVSLEDLTYGPGVGWYVQKTIRLDPEQIDALLRSLCCVRQVSSCPAGSCRGAAEPTVVEITDSKILHMLRGDEAKR